MNAARVDVSKGKSTVSVLCPPGQVVAKPFEARPTGSGLRELAKYLKSLESETRVVMEHTGRYYEPTAQYLSEAGIFVSAVNPKLIKDYGNNSLRKVKTDKADSKKTAKYALDNWAELRQYTSMDKTRYQLKAWNRPAVQPSHCRQNSAAQKNSLIAILDMTYPGANELFASPARGDRTQKWVDFVRTFWHWDYVCGVSLAAFTERYRKWCRKNKYNFSRDKAAQIYADAREAVPGHGLPPEKQAAGQPGVPVYGQETVQRQAVSGLYDRRCQQIPAYLLWHSEGVFSFAGTAASGWHRPEHLIGFT